MTKQMVRFNFYISEKLNHAIKLLALQERKSYSQMVRELLKLGFRKAK